MEKFKLVSKYKPSGDQPKAIEALSNGILSGKKEQILLGVTGSGKTFTMRMQLNILYPTMTTISLRLIFQVRTAI